MKPHRMPRSMAKRKAPPGAFQGRSLPRLSGRETASGWSVFGLPGVIVTDGNRDLIGSVAIAQPDGGWLVLTPPDA
ncbi:hypothetical protein [Sphingobium yanoikuyae]|jgi:hypothetical protein|uniref:hypothetical protein n=1 Tax=Sphingobium yanoikuyae TaxID=13690 RepID=UPI00241F5F98|nr:hypothetical protein [Sphingobium yanoikuyae]